MPPQAKFELSASDKTRAAFQSMDNNLNKLTGSVRKFHGIVGAAFGIGGLGAIVSMSTNASRETLAYADALKISVQELTAWGHASETVSVSQEKFADILKDLNERVGEAFSQGTGEGAEALEILNLQAAELVNMSADQKLLQIGEALENIKTNDEKVFIMEQMASDASLLLPLLENNAEQFGRLREEAIRSGIAISDVDAQVLRETNIELQQAQATFEAMGRDFTITLAPVITSLTSMMGDARNFINTLGIDEGAQALAIFQTKIEPNVALLREAGIHMDNIDPTNLERMERILKAASLHDIDLDYESELSGLQTQIHATANSYRGLTLAQAAIVQSTGEHSKASTHNQQKLNELEVQLASLTGNYIDAANASEALSEGGGAANQPIFDLETAEQFGTRMFQIAREAYPEATMSALEFGEAQRVIAEQTLAVNDANTKKFEAFSQTLLSEEERLALSYQSRAEMLVVAHENEQISEATMQALLLHQEATYLNDRAQLNQDAMTAEQQMWSSGWKGKMSVMGGVMNSMSSLMDTNSKKMFKVGQAAAIGGAVIDTQKAASGAYSAMASIPYVGPALGVAAALAAVAAGSARVNAIRNAKFGGGSVGGGGGGSAPQPVFNASPQTGLPQQPQEASGRNLTVNVTVNGSVMAEELDEIVGRAVIRSVDSELLTLTVNGEQVVAA